MASPEDHKHITTVLIPQLLERFNAWGREYKQPRDLGIRGEFAGLYRKTRKLKTLFWDSDYPAADRGWREGPREIIMEVVAHGLLMLVDWDNAHPEEAPTKLGESDKEDADAPNYQADSDQEDELYYPDCGKECNLAQKHTYRGDCGLADEASFASFH